MYEPLEMGAKGAQVLYTSCLAAVTVDSLMTTKAID